MNDSLRSDADPGWLVVTANEVCKKITKGTTPPKSEIDPSSKIPFLRVNNLTLGGAFGVSGDLIFVNNIAHRSILSRSVAYPGDILMNIVGPPLGKISRLTDTYIEYNLNQAILIFRPDTKKVNPDFLYYYICSEQCQNWLETRAKKTSGQKNLTIELCKELPLPLPAPSEQQKIAQILSTWDKAIETAERLVANATKLKRALMHRFLDANTWPEVRIGDLGNIRSAGVDKKELEDEQPVRLLNYLDVLRRDYIYSGQLDHWVTAPGRQIENCDIRQGDVFFTPSSETREDIGHSAVAMEDVPQAAYSYHVIRFRPSMKMDLLFSAFAFKSRRFHEQCYSYCEGSGQRYVISQDYFRDFKIRIPPIEWQRDIGRKLFDSDQMITCHQRDVADLKSTKQALMQQLLTGRRRVNT